MRLRTSKSPPSTLTPPATQRQTPRNEGSGLYFNPFRPCPFRIPLSDLLSDALKDATQKVNP